MEFLGYFGALVTGVTLGMVGGGGSILIVPVLVYLFQVAPSLATAYSLFIVGLVSLIGVWRYHRLGLIDYRTAAVFATPALFGVFLVRRFLIPVLSPTIATWGPIVVTRDGLIMTVFAVVMVAAAVSMIRKSKSKPEPTQETAPQYRYGWIGLEGALVGAVTGFVGAGGGFLIIPALVVLAKLPMKMAVGTSLLIISIKSLIGFLGDIGAAAAVDWGFLAGVIAAAAVGMVGGTRLSHLVPEERLKPAFGWFVLVMGNFIFLRQVV